MPTDEQISKIAKVCHAVNRAYAERAEGVCGESWEECSQATRESAIRGVIFKIDNPESTPRDIHEKWLKDKIDNGWIWGTTKNESRKFHPCCMAYGSLPEKQKTKDYLFMAVIDSMKDIFEDDGQIGTLDLTSVQRDNPDDVLRRDFDEAALEYGAPDADEKDIERSIHFFRRNLP